MRPARLARLREEIGQPLPLAYHPLYRFYEGGSLTRRFRGLPGRPHDWWSEDWVGSCTCANNAGPDGRTQGLSMVELPGAGAMTLQEIIEALPEEMVGAPLAGAWGQITGVLVKLLSPAGQVPLHAQPHAGMGAQASGVPLRQDRGMDPAGHARRRHRAGLCGHRLHAGHRP